MYSHTTETVIPRYPFEQDEATGNTMFRINRNDCVVNYRKSDFLVPHRKDYFFWALVRQGSNRHWIDMEPYVLKPDTFYFTVPQQIHLKEDAHPFTGISISFTREFLAMDESGMLGKLPIIQNPYNGHELIFTPQDISFVEDVLEKIFAEYYAPDNWQNSMLLAYMKVLMIFLSRLYTKQFKPADQYTEDRQLLKKFLGKVDESFTELHDVASYASLMNLSAGHLSELVKEQSGKPAIIHIHERLILEARRLLFHTDHSIKEIAYQLGFEDTSYFNRFFKRITEVTPVQYRNTIREMYH